MVTVPQVKLVARFFRSILSPRLPEGYGEMASSNGSATNPVVNATCGPSTRFLEYCDVFPVAFGPQTVARKAKQASPEPRR